MTPEQLDSIRQRAEAANHAGLTGYSCDPLPLLAEIDRLNAELTEAKRRLSQQYDDFTKAGDCAAKSMNEKCDQLNIALAERDKELAEIKAAVVELAPAPAISTALEWEELHRKYLTLLETWEQQQPVVEAAKVWAETDRWDEPRIRVRHFEARRVLAEAVDALPSSSDGAGQTDEAKFLVWSHEHHAWWGPNHAGYYDKLNSAGVYTRDEAEKICNPLNWTRDGRPHEVMVECPPNFEVFKVARQLREQLGDMVREATMRALETRCVRCTTLDDADSKAAECRCRTNCGSFRCPEPRAAASVSAPAEEA